MSQRLKHIQTILAVDDDPDVRATIGRTLKREGHRVIEAEDGQKALQLAAEHRPDVIILDISLAGMNGFELCAYLRNMPFVNHTPILFLSVYQSAQHVAKALDCGGDDYLRKPFAPRELTARVRALLRRAVTRRPNPTYTLCLNEHNHSVTINGRQIMLTPTEFSLLEFMACDQDEHHSANNLLEKLWQYPPGGGDTALVRNHIRNLRRKIEQDPDHPAIIVSLHGRGYTVRAHVIQDETSKSNPVPG